MELIETYKFEQIKNIPSDYLTQIIRWKLNDMAKDQGKEISTDQAAHIKSKLEYLLKTLFASWTLVECFNVLNNGMAEVYTKSTSMTFQNITKWFKIAQNQMASNYSEKSQDEKYDYKFNPSSRYPEFIKWAFDLCIDVEEIKKGKYKELVEKYYKAKSEGSLNELAATLPRYQSFGLIY